MPKKQKKRQSALAGSAPGQRFSEKFVTALEGKMVTWFANMLVTVDCATRNNLRKASRHLQGLVHAFSPETTLHLFSLPSVEERAGILGALRICFRVHLHLDAAKDSSRHIRAAVYAAQLASLPQVALPSDGRQRKGSITIDGRNEVTLDCLVPRMVTVFGLDLESLRYDNIKFEWQADTWGHDTIYTFLTSLSMQGQREDNDFGAMTRTKSEAAEISQQIKRLPNLTQLNLDYLGRDAEYILPHVTTQLRHLRTRSAWPWYYLVPDTLTFRHLTTLDSDFVIQGVTGHIHRTLKSILTTAPLVRLQVKSISVAVLADLNIPTLKCIQTANLIVHAAYEGSVAATQRMAQQMRTNVSKAGGLELVAMDSTTPPTISLATIDVSMPVICLSLCRLAPNVDSIQLDNAQLSPHLLICVSSLLDCRKVLFTHRCQWDADAFTHMARYMPSVHTFVTTVPPALHELVGLFLGTDRPVTLELNKRALAKLPDWERMVGVLKTGFGTSLATLELGEYGDTDVSDQEEEEDDEAEEEDGGGDSGGGESSSSSSDGDEHGACDVALAEAGCKRKKVSKKDGQQEVCG